MTWNKKAEENFYMIVGDVAIDVCRDDSDTPYICACMVYNRNKIAIYSFPEFVLCTTTLEGVEYAYVEDIVRRNYDLLAGHVGGIY